LPGDALWGIGLGMLAFGNLILMAPHERSRPLPSGKCYGSSSVCFVFAALMVASKRWLPDDFGAPVARFIRHPVLVGTLWAFTVWFIYRRYRRTTTDAHNAV